MARGVVCHLDRGESVIEQIVETRFLEPIPEPKKSGLIVVTLVATLNPVSQVLW